jgi:DNA-binding MarR family transcriptional regulator
MSSGSLVVGLVTRERHPENRRVHVVSLTAAGEQPFVILLNRVRAFDGALQPGRLVNNAAAAAGGHRESVEAR